MSQAAQTVEGVERLDARVRKQPHETGAAVVEIVKFDARRHVAKCTCGWSSAARPGVHAAEVAGKEHAAEMRRQEKERREAKQAVEFVCAKCQEEKFEVPVAAKFEIVGPGVREAREGSVCRKCALDVVEEQIEESFWEPCW